MKLKELRQEIISKLRAAEIDSPEADLGLILMNVLNIDKTQLIIGDISLSNEDIATISHLAERLIAGEPVQYITRKCEFMSLSFMVTPGVLIPRNDTEILVEEVMKRLNHNTSLSVADIGCGSGCIGISLAKYMKNISVLSVDISQTALEITKQNAVQNGVSDRFEFLHLDITKHTLPDNVDCIVSNPPYIRTDVIDTLDKKVKDFEPLAALDGGHDGLDFYTQIAKNAMLNPGGLLAFEIGYDQGQSVSNILLKNNYTKIEIIKDLEGRDRVVLGYTTK